MTLRVFSEGPYYDDFAEAKGFHRILFKPGVAVQAREMTQLQTMLQKQIERHGSSIFQEGSMVLGGKTQSDFTAHFLRVSTTLLNGAVVTDLIGKMLVGVTSGATAKVVSYIQEAEYPDTYTLLVKTYSDVPFTQAENLKYQPDPLVAGTNLATLINVAYVFQGKAAVFSIQQGVFYSRGNFVYCPEQVIPVALDIYDTGGSVISDASAPSFRVGLKVVESIVDSDTDSSLLDPSLGSYNYNAPGADRYVISLVLTSKPLLKQAVAKVGVDGTGALTTFTIVNGGSGYPTTNFNTIPVTITDSNTGANGTALVAGVDNYTGAITSIIRTAAGSGYTVGTVKVTVAQPTETDDAYIELARFDTGVLTKDVKYPLYSVIGDTMARRTWDESGDYALNPFLVQVADAVDPDYFTVAINSGKAYVKGYEVNLVGSTKIDVLRARDAAHQQSTSAYNINAYYGNYVVVLGSAITKPFDPAGFPLLKLKNATVQIGTARLAQVTYDSGVGVASYYRFHLSDINITDPASGFVDVQSIEILSDATTNVPVALAHRALIEPSVSALLHPLDNTNTKSISGVLNYSYWVKKTGTAAGGSVTITQTGGVQFKPVSAAPSDMASAYVIYDTTAGGIIDMTGITVAASGTSPATAVISGLVTGHNYTIFAVVEATGVAKKTKTLNNGSGTGTNSMVYTVLAADVTNGYITLDKWDGVKLVSVVVGADDITSRFTFDSGMRDASYQYARILLNAGQTMPVAGSTLTITYDYYFHGATGNFFCVDSYPDYDSIPTYVAKDGKSYHLNDVLDFRPNADTSNPPVMPYVNDDIIVSYTFYLGRIDLLTLTSHGELVSVEGTPALMPTAPKADKNSMAIAVLAIRPYTANVKTDVTTKLISNRRYTMSDIATLDKRIGYLEYYNTLNLLEKNVKELLVLDTNGLDRFKNGSLVDAFAGHSVSDIANPDLACSISIADNFMTCPFDVRSLIPRVVQSTRSNVAVGDKIVTLAYSSVPFITQGQSSESMSVNPFNVAAFFGKVNTFPSSDFWIETTQLPDVIVNVNGANDNLTSDSAYAGTNVYGTTYESWSTNYDGRYGADRLTTQDDINAHNHDNGLGPWLNADGSRVVGTLTTTSLKPTFTVSTKSLGSKIVNTSVIPLMRPIDIYFAATGLKPNTHIYPFFDGVNISADVAKTDVLTLAPYSGSVVPQITAFAYQTMAFVSQTVTGGVATGKVIMCRNNRMHVVREPRSLPFAVNGNPLEMRWDNISPHGDPLALNSSYTVSAVSPSSRQWLITNGSTATWDLDHTVATPFTHTNLTVYQNGVVQDYSTKWTLNGPGTQLTWVGTPPAATDKVFVLYDWVIRTDASGYLSGIFQVPASTFHTGERILRFIDASDNTIAHSHTLGEYTFSSEGIKNTLQNTIVSTRTISGYQEETTIEQFPMWTDPLAESFLVDAKVNPNGVFLESVDLCFRNADPSIPVSIELRPMVNGYPHSSLIVPGSAVTKDPSEVNITNVIDLPPMPGIGYTVDGELVPSFSDPRTVTNFKFSAPIFLKPGIDYALVVKSDSDLYETFVARVGSTQLGSGSTITSQPYTGSMFLSQNASTWTADQTADLMFQLNRCEFVPSGNVNVVPADFDETTPFDYDIIWAASNNIEFDGIANATYGVKTTPMDTLVLDAAFSPFQTYTNNYQTSRKRLTSDSTNIAAVTAQTTYTLPWLNVTIDDIDIILKDPVDASVENVQSKALYTVRDKSGAPAGTKEIVWQSVTIPPPLTGQTIRVVRANSVVLNMALATTDTKVSPYIDLSQFALRFIHNIINAGGVRSVNFKLPDASVGANSTMTTPTITLATGTSGQLLCETTAGALTGVTIANGGTGYSSGSATVSAPGGLGGVTATVLLTVNGGGTITGVTITNAGSGYAEATLNIVSTTGSGAVVYPILKQQTWANGTSGMVTGYRVDDEGVNYIDNWTATLVRTDASTTPITVTNECTPTGGNCLARYISRRVTLVDGFDAKDILAYLTAMKPQGTGVEMYYKVLAAEDNTDWSATPYVYMPKTGDVQSLNFEDYKEVEYKTVGGTTEYSGFPTYKMFAVKIVLTALNPAFAPRVHDLRAMALATTFA